MILISYLLNPSCIARCALVAESLIALAWQKDCLCILAVEERREYKKEKQENSSYLVKHCSIEKKQRAMGKTHGSLLFPLEN